MILYFTYNDQPSGVYWSQVTDVVSHLNTLGGPHVRLFALVSGRDFFRTRRAIKQRLPDAIVWPMVPRMRRWKMNLELLSIFLRLHKPTGIICRGVMTTWMALRLRDRGLVKKVCFDARGAYAAEWEEYRIIDDDALIAQFRVLENDAVNKSDFRLAVSNALVDHWRERYGYPGSEAGAGASDAHVVIPCTLGQDFEKPVAGMIDRFRNDVGHSPEDVLLVYSGSTAGWQSFKMLEELLVGIMSAHANVHVLFLSRPDNGITALQDRFPGRVSASWADPSMVKQLLVIHDHGILLREDTITNRVASPTKFAEYLVAGVPVLISPKLGDLSALVCSERLGVVIDERMPALLPTTIEDRLRMERFAMDHFTKKAHNTSYRSLLNQLS